MQFKERCLNAISDIFTINGTMDLIFSCISAFIILVFIILMILAVIWEAKSFFKSIKQWNKGKCPHCGKELKHTWGRRIPLWGYEECPPMIFSCPDSDCCYYSYIYYGIILWKYQHKIERW